MQAIPMTGKQLRARRIELGLSQKEVASLLGVSSQGMMCMYEMGDRPIPQDIRIEAQYRLFSVHGTKKAFVTHQLKDLLHRIDSDIADVDYEVRVDDDEEFVRITYTNGYPRVICVTRDSLAALTRDVLNHL